MQSILRPALLAALLATAAPLAAQEAGDDAAAAEAGAGEPATEQVPGLDMGTPVDEEGRVAGEPYVREEFGDWQIRCIANPEGEDPCQLYQLLNGADDNPVAEFTLVPIAGGGEAVAGAVVIVPLETQLTERLTLAVDGGQARRYEFAFCNHGGCVARFGLTQEQLNGFKGGRSATVSIVPAAAPDQRVELTLSLTGFTAAYDYTGNPPE